MHKVLFFFFYPKIPTIKASFDVAVIQRHSRFFGMSFLKDKKQKRRSGGRKKQQGKGRKRGIVRRKKERKDRKQDKIYVIQSNESFVCFSGSAALPSKERFKYS